VRKKIEPPFEGEVFLRMWVTVPLKAKTWEEAAEELKSVTIDDARLAPDDDIIDARVERITVRHKANLEAGGL
jgi:hypothetical protein